ncbi:MAG: DUF4421 domain-containing protein [Algoriphagus sp.]|uniref:DUF4421 domain-containing protein n=1 Tax=Algoriphagus sp. TaxID=1872435 RepID=UPI0027321649|nr:DUF4421 domain-containing protein [Algoriphagus sp.]MDP2042438.1 DUF4421 domain-containing protein [Algoriphagus sp.]MDP3474355.1 DUF4421 domain-containing protein [Algoriphagus sp.]
MFAIIPFFTLAQNRGVDTTYIDEQEEKLVLRLYFSKKYTEYRVADPQLVYSPNTGLNTGFGATFQKFTLNLAGPLGFLNPQREKDFPRTTDLQVHIYPTFWIIDLFGQFYNGYKVQGPGEDKLARADLSIRKFGVNANYVFHGDKISLAAAFQQSAIQKKSAFSPFIGAEAYYVKVSGDSLVLPESDFTTNQNYERADFFHIGPNAGMIGTLVFGKGFFLTGSAAANLGFSISTPDQETADRNTKLKPGYFLRGFAGYNGLRFSLNLNYVYKNLALAEVNELGQSINTGNYRFIFAYKINAGPKLSQNFPKYNPMKIVQRIFKKD